MRDQFERNINYMRVSVTDRCNLRCVYCMPKDGVQQISHDEILTFDEIARVCRIGAERDFQDQADRRRTAGAKGD